MRRLLVALVVALVLLGLVVTPVWAIADPTSTSIKGVKVFQNVFEDDDFLFFVRYDVNYSADPDPPASDTFLVALYDTDGTTLLYQRALNYYGLNIISIYISPVQAASLTWESEYVIKVMGNPSIFGELTEGVNMATRTLNPLYDYYSGNMEASREGLGIYCIATARILEDDPDWPDLVTGTGKLNSAGVITFNDAIPGLSSVCPSIYGTATASPVLEEAERTITLEGTVAGTFTSGETVTGGTSETEGVFIAGSQTDTRIKVTHTGVTMYQVGETATGGVSGATIDITKVIVGELETEAVGRTGQRLRNALDGLGDWLGISGGAMGGITVFLFFALTAGFIFTSTGNVHGAILIAIPVILLGNWIGMLSFVITWALVILVITLFAILFIMGRMA